jgi:hypothetical protein
MHSPISESCLSLATLLSLPLYFVASLLHPLLVFSKPRQVESETELYEAAVRALMFRAFFVRERFSLLLCGVVASVIPAEGAAYVRA